MNAVLISSSETSFDFDSDLWVAWNFKENRSFRANACSLWDIIKGNKLMNTSSTKLNSCKTSMALTLITRFSPKDTGNVYKIEIVQGSSQNFLGLGSFFGISINISSTTKERPSRGREMLEFILLNTLTLRFKR